MTPLPFRPRFLLRNGHLQTVLVGLSAGHQPAYNASQRIVRLDRYGLDDEESLVVHEERGAPLADDAPLVILLHGLGGCHGSAYLARLAPRLRAIGLEVWRVDLRGCGAGFEHAELPPNAGRSDDLAAVVAAAQETFPQKRVHIVGFSLSGNIVLKMLGEVAGGASPVSLDLSAIDSALAVAPPVNLQQCADNMDRLSRRAYTRFYLRSLHSQVEQRRNRWPKWRAVQELPRPKTIREFDDRYTAPLSGYADATEYYRRASAEPWLGHISTPTTVLLDRHDPIVPANSFNHGAFRQDTTRIVVTDYGGHMGYFGVDAEGRPMRWMEYFVEYFLKQELAKSSPAT